MPWSVRVAGTLPRGVRVSNPLLGEDPTDTVAVFDLGMPHDLDVFLKADAAAHALFVDVEPYIEVLAKLGGYSFFRIDGSDALLAANYSLPEASWLAVVEKAPAKYDHINFKPPQGAADAAAKGLDYRKKAGGKGGLSTSEASEQGIGSGVARAASLKNRQELSPDTVKRMKAFFDRHEKNKGVAPEHKGEPWKDRGHVAWLLWGGDPGRAWANKVVGQMKAADEKTEKGDLAVGDGDPGQLQPEQGRRYRRVRTKGAVIVDSIGLLTKSAVKIENEDGEETEERYILGVVLEPDEVDSQGDTISAEEIRQAAHGYMQDFGNVGLQHQTFVNDKIKILETYIAPVDFEIGGQQVKAGTWLMAFRVLDDSIWKAIKEGLLTGLSIGGTGLRLAVA